MRELPTSGLQQLVGETSVLAGHSRWWQASSLTLLIPSPIMAFFSFKTAVILVALVAVFAVLDQYKERMYVFDPVKLQSIARANIAKNLSTHDLSSPSSRPSPSIHLPFSLVIFV